MARRTFFLRLMQVVDECAQSLLMENLDPVEQSFSLSRLETLQRSLIWARGRLIDIPDADQLLSNLAEIIQLVRSAPRSVQQDSFTNQAPLNWSGHRGRPFYSITQEQLTFLTSCGFTAPQMADILGVSVHTVRNHLRQFNITRGSLYAEPSEAHLDELVQQIVAGNDLMGPEAVSASLCASGLQVQRRRICASMLRLNPGAAAFRSVLQQPQRQTYRAARPNSSWHVDGNHKLIRWRIVVHGAIDEYSRLVFFLHASSNNHRSTVLESFVPAVVNYGVPSRVRTGRGGGDYSVWMIFRGGRGLLNVYCDLFNHLENEGVIDCNNEMHLWALHYIYLPRINRDLRDFIGSWNNHGLRTRRSKTPLQIFVLGCLEQIHRPSTAMEELFRATATAGDSCSGSPGVSTASPSVTPSAPSASQREELELMLDWPERVTVPEVQYTLGNDLLQQVVAQFDPLCGPREARGIQEVRDLISFLSSARR